MTYSKRRRWLLLNPSSTIWTRLFELIGFEPLRQTRVAESVTTPGGVGFEHRMDADSTSDDLPNIVQTGFQCMQDRSRSIRHLAVFSLHFSRGSHACTVQGIRVLFPENGYRALPDESCEIL